MFVGHHCTPGEPTNCIHLFVETWMQDSHEDKNIIVEDAMETVGATL